MKKIMSIDLESTSLVDLRKAGASRYSRDPSTQIIVCAWAIDGGPVNSVTTPDAPPDEVVAHIRAGGVIQAWNAFFEQQMLSNVWGLDLGPEQISCSMQRALYAGLPGALGDCGPALGLAIVKDITAHGLMLRMSRPRSLEPMTWWHDTDPEKLEALRKYCVRDVEAEREIANIIPALPAGEREISILDRRANNHGVRLDLSAIDKMLSVADAATKRLNARCTQLTNGAVTSPGSQTAKLIAWLGEHAPESLGKQHVADALKRKDLPDHIREVLELRQLAAKSSVKKLKAMLACVDDDGVVRGTIQYYGASRTGRASGRLIQPQNFPRPSIKKPNDAISDMMRGMSLDALEMIYDAPLNVVASCLRGVLIPRDGCKFIVYDLAQIEARVLAWLAGQMDILAVFAAGGDVYSHTAKKLGFTGPNARQYGKVAVLGLGYGLGAKKFVDFAAASGLILTLEETTKIVADWRGASSKITSLWRKSEAAVRDCITAANAKPDKRAVIRINDKLLVEVKPARNGSMLMLLKLPSGRSLFYRDIRIAEDYSSGERREVITYSGVDQTTKKWGAVRTYSGKIVENLTQAVARDVIFGAATEIERRQLGDLILSVHDELIYEVPAQHVDERLKAIHEIMNTAPAWANGLPVAAEGGVMSRYGK